VLLDTVLEALPGRGNVVILPADAIESLASMINPAYGNATQDFVWVTSSPMRTLGPQYRLNCSTQPSTTGQVSSQPRPSCGENEARSRFEGVAFGFAGTVLGVVIGGSIFLCRDAAKKMASVTQRVPQQINKNNMQYEKNGAPRDNMDYSMKNMKKEKNDSNEKSEQSQRQGDVEASPLEAVSSSDDND
jgi:hypothetical protein